VLHVPERWNGDGHGGPRSPPAPPIRSGRAAGCRVAVPKHEAEMEWWKLMEEKDERTLRVEK